MQSITRAHPETAPCHSEPFDRLRTGSAKNPCGSSNYEILRRPAPAGLLRMTPINAISGWKLTIKNLTTIKFFNRTSIISEEGMVADGGEAMWWGTITFWLSVLFCKLGAHGWLSR